MAMVDTGTRSNDGGYTYVPAVTVEGTGNCRLWLLCIRVSAATMEDTDTSGYVTGYKYLLLWWWIQVPVAILEDTGNCGHRGR